MANLRRMGMAAQRLTRLVADRLEEDRCVQVAGNLTFTTLLALVPIFTIAITSFAAFPVFDDWASAFKIFLLTTLVPEVGGKIITVYMQQFADNAAKLTAVGLAFLAVTAVLLLVSIEKVFNGIWRARRPRSAVQRLVIYGSAIVIGPLLIGASLSMTSWIIAQSVPSVNGAKSIEEMLLRVVPVMLNGAAFGLLYLTLPNRRVRVQDAFAGGIFAAFLFELMKRGFALYVELFPTYDLIYGTFATVPIFLLWLYLSWCVVLLGAVVAAVLPQWRLGQDAASPRGATAFFPALRLVEALDEARRRGTAPNVRELAASLAILDDRADLLLDIMEQRAWVRRGDGGGWRLAVDLENLTLADVYRAFAFDPWLPNASDAGLSAEAYRRVVRSVAELEEPLRAFMPLGHPESVMPTAGTPSPGVRGDSG